MSGKRYSPEEIISKLRKAEVDLAKGSSVVEVIRRLGVTKVTQLSLAQRIWRDESRAGNASRPSKTSRY